MPTVSQHRYFLWLMDLIGADAYSDNGYSFMLSELMDISFYALIDRDNNRAEDGVYLRHLYEIENGEHVSDLGECRVFEMLVALARRCDKDLMYTPSYGDRSSEWFWMMMRNLGLTKYSNDNYNQHDVRQIITRFLDRDYSKYGTGGLFPLRNIAAAKRDQREIEIWDQMQLYMIEKYEN